MVWAFISLQQLLVELPMIPLVSCNAHDADTVS